MASGINMKRPPVKALIYWATVLAVWAIIFAVGFLAVFAIDLPDTSSLYKTDRSPSITYLDRSGALIAVRGSQFAPPVEIDEMPDYVPAAFIAIEDRRFYHHPGFDPMGITRAAFRNLSKDKGSNLAGGSTITQQLAKNLFFSSQQTLKRKIQELILAVWLEIKFTKKEILALYLNRVYFGSGAYGIEAAAQRYFNKQAKDLTIGEAAMLAGMLKAPSTYSPLSDKDRATRRTTIVLNEMVQAKVITPAQRDEVFKQGVKVTRTLATEHAQYFVDWLNSQLGEMIDISKIEDDLIVETTLDLPIQTDAERAVKAIMARDAKKKVEQAALVAVDGEGRIRALIGGVSYTDSQFNRASDAKRQAGSAFKPFVYLTAMETGNYMPSTLVVDEAYSVGDWAPENYSKTYIGEITLTEALAKSVNTVAARLANDVGRGNVARRAHELGIDSKINTDPAMALGTADVSPIEMAQAYVPFSNGGYKARAHGIIRIRTSKGQILYQHKVSKDERVQTIHNPALGYMNQMMREVVRTGTGSGVKLTQYDIAGKTGTTSDYRDAWFVGYTGGFVTAVWVGRDNNSQMARVTGAGTPAAIWREFMAKALTRIKVSPIPAGTQSELSQQADSAVTDLLNDAAVTDPAPITVDPTPPEPKKEEPQSLDDVFSDAQNQTQ